MHKTKAQPQTGVTSGDTLAKKLVEYEKSGISFHEAKQALLAENYSEHDITLAVASNAFDGKVRTPTVHPDKELYENNPQLAKDVADALMEANVHLHDKATGPVFTPWSRVNRHYMKWSFFESGYNLMKSTIDTKHYTKTMRNIRTAIAIVVVVLIGYAVVDYIVRLIIAANG